MKPHSIVRRAAEKLNCSEHSIFLYASSVRDGDSLVQVKEADEAYQQYRRQGEIPRWVEDYCIEALAP